MKTEGLILIGVLVYLWSRKLTPTTATGIKSITPGPISLPCYDSMGNIVDAGTSAYCPPGTNTRGGSVLCADGTIGIIDSSGNSNCGTFPTVDQPMSINNSPDIGVVVTV